MDLIDFGTHAISRRLLLKVHYVCYGEAVGGPANDNVIYNLFDVDDCDILLANKSLVVDGVEFVKFGSFIMSSRYRHYLSQLILQKDTIKIIWRVRRSGYQDVCIRRSSMWDLKKVYLDLIAYVNGDKEGTIPNKHKSLEEKVNEIYYAPGMPGAVEASVHFDEESKKY